MNGIVGFGFVNFLFGSSELCLIINIVLINLVMLVVFFRWLIFGLMFLIIRGLDFGFL